MTSQSLFMRIVDTVKKHTPTRLHGPLRKALMLALLARNTIRRIRFHILPPKLGDWPYSQRVRYFRKIDRITRRVPCAHSEKHICLFVDALLSLPSSLEGSVVEAGCFKGGSAAKFSVVANMLGRKLVLFDSFEGLPDNKEQHERSILGHSIHGWFQQGSFDGTLSEVRDTIQQFGKIEACEFMPGWFEDTIADLFQENLRSLYRR